MCIYIDCPHKCYEYDERILSDKTYYEWTRKEEKCEKSKEEEK